MKNIDNICHTNTLNDSSRRQVNNSICESESRSKNSNSSKLFFTASDLLETINSCIEESYDVNDTEQKNTNENTNSISSGGFELERRLPNGRTRRATESDIALANFQSKLKQASVEISTFTPLQKLEWAKNMRMEGNKLFSTGEYKEAMDVYLVCLVAVEKQPEEENGKTEADKDMDTLQVLDTKDKMEDEIKLPVLMNLSMCTLKLGMYSKTQRFCSLVLEIPGSEHNPKVFYRRGKARMLMGLYESARLDFDSSLKLLSSSLEKSNMDDKKTMNEITVVQREIKKLIKLEKAGKINEKKQRNAMKNLFSAGKQNPGNIHSRIGNNGKDPSSKSSRGSPSIDTTNGNNSSLYEDLMEKTKLNEERVIEYSTLESPSSQKLNYLSQRQKHLREKVIERHEKILGSKNAISNIFISFFISSGIVLLLHSRFSGN